MCTRRDEFLKGYQLHIHSILGGFAVHLIAEELELELTYMCISQTHVI
jgi:hypothetical protein